MKNRSLPTKILSVFLAVLMVLPMVATSFPGVIGMFATTADAAQSDSVITSSSGHGNFKQSDYSSRSYPTLDGANIIVPGDEEIRVLQVADLQMSGPITEDCISAIRQGIARVKPHLIVLTGDNAMYCGTQYEWENTMANIASYFYDEDGKKIPFAVTFGNHDTSGNDTTDDSDEYEASKEIRYQYNFCVMALGAIDYDYDDDNAIVVDASGTTHTLSDLMNGGAAAVGVNDVGTGCVNVYNADGTVKQKVLVLNSAVDEGDSGYGKLGYDQDGDIDEYTYSLACTVLSWEVAQNVPTIAFQHIPLREFYSADGILKVDASGLAAYSVDSTLVTSNGTVVSGNSFSAADGTTGVYNEQCCCSYSSTELQYLVLANHSNNQTYTINNSNAGDMNGQTVELPAHNNVVGIFYGHDHSNTLTGTGTVNYNSEAFTLTQGYGGGMDRNHGTEIAYISGYTIGGTGANPTLQKDTWSVDTILDDYNTTFGAKYSYSDVPAQSDGSSQTYVNKIALGERSYSFTFSSDTAAEYEQTAKDNAVANAGEGAILLEYLSNDDDEGADLNYGFEYGAWIYAAYTTTTDITDAYTDLVVYHGTNPSATLTKEKYGTVITYELLSDINLNDGSTKESSTAAYLYGTKDPAAGIPITEIGISSLSIMYTNTGKRMALTGGWYGTAEYSTDNSFQDRADANVSMGDTTPSIFLQFKAIGSADPNITATQTSTYDITCQYYDLAKTYSTYASKSDSYKYTAESWAAFKAARTAAKTLKTKLDNNRFVTDETKTSITNTTNALVAAYNALEPKSGESSSKQAISTTATPAVTVAVPETVYLKAATGNATTGEYYLNNTISNGELVASSEGSSKTGNITLNLGAGASNVNVTAKLYSDATTLSTDTLTLTDSENGNLVTGVNYGLEEDASSLSVNIGSLNLATGLAAKSTALIEWKFVITYQRDDIDGDGSTEPVELTYYAYTVVYAPSTETVGAIATARGYVSGKTRSANVSAITWISGIDGLASSNVEFGVNSADGSVTDRAGYFSTSPLINLGSPTYYATDQSALNAFVTADSTASSDNGYYGSSTYVHGAYYGVSQTTTENGSSQRSGTGKIAVDVSRYDNLKKIPNFYVALEIGAQEAKYESFEYNDSEKGNCSIFAAYTVATATNSTAPTMSGYDTTSLKTLTSTDWVTLASAPAKTAISMNSNVIDAHSNESADPANKTPAAIFNDVDGYPSSLRLYMPVDWTVNNASDINNKNLYLVGQVQHYKYATATSIVTFSTLDKSTLRKNVGAAYNAGLQEKWDTNSTFAAFKSQLMADALKLGTPTDTTNSSDTLTAKQTACANGQLGAGAINNVNVGMTISLNRTTGEKSMYIAGLTNQFAATYPGYARDISALGDTAKGTVTKGNWFLTQSSPINGYTYVGSHVGGPIDSSLDVFAADADTMTYLQSNGTLDKSGAVNKHEYTNSTTTADLTHYHYYTSPEYTLTIDMDGGTIGNGYTSVVGNEGTVLVGGTDICAKTGYTFVGWQIVEGSGSVDGLNYTFGDGDATIKALWKGNAQDVVINANGGVYNGNILYLTDGQDSATSKFGTTDGTITATKESDDTISITANSTETGNYYSNSNFVYAYLQAGKSYTLSYKCNVASGDAVYFYILGTENKSLKPGDATEYTDSLVIKNRAGTTVTDNGDGTYTRTLNFTVGADDTENNETNWDRLENASDATMVYFFRLDYNNCGTNKIEISDMTVVPTSACDVNIKAISGSTMQVNEPTYGGHEFLNWTVSGNDAVLTGDDLTVGTATTTLTANWKQAVIIYDVNHDNIQPNIYPIYETATNSNGIYYSYNKETGEISLWGSNDTISADTVFELPLTEFLPSQGTYIFTLTRTSGSFTGYKDNCLVFDLCTASGASPSTGRMNNDFAQHRFESSDTVSWSFDLTDAQAKEIGSIKFRIYANGAGIDFGTESNPFKFTIKVEQGTTATAYSPSARYANTTGTYSTDLISLADLTGKQFAGWATTPTGMDTDGNSTVVTADDALNGSQTLFAQWDANKYNVIYNGNGATSGSTTASVHYVDEAKTLTKNGFVREYTVTYDANGGNALAKTSDTATYTFNSWNTAEDGSGTSYDDEQSVINLSSTENASINLYAQWNSASVNLPTASKDKTADKHYTFKGWYDAAEGGNQIVAADATTYTPTANTTLYAQYTESDHDWNEGTVTKAATCTETGTKTVTCTVCGQTSTQTIDKLSHSYTVYVSEVTKATCTANATATYKCANCTATTVKEVEGTKLAHVYSGAAKDNEDGTHSFKCVNGCGNYGAKINCSYDSGEITTPATCTAKGVKTYTCTVCGGTKTSDVSMKGHTLTKTEATAATCQKAGNNAYWTCSVCSKVFSDSTGATETTVAAQTIAQLAHSYTGEIKDNGNGTHSFKCVNGCNNYGGTVSCSYTTEGAEVTAATCQTNATYKYTCACGAETTKEKANTQLDHSFTGDVKTNNNGTHSYKCVNGCNNYGNETPCDYNVVVTAPTCTAKGYTTYTCKVCSYTYTADETELLGHSYTEYVAEVTAATCQANATATYKCANCDATTVKEVENSKLDHSYTGDVKDNGNGTHSFKCVNGCEGYGNETACDYNEVVTAPTCTTTGYTTYTCKVCSYTYTADETELLGHSYTVYVSEVTAATCQANATATYKCANCDATTVKEVENSKLAHSYTGDVKDNGDGTHSFKCVNGCEGYGKEIACDYNVVVTAPTTETKGYTTHTCKVCGHSYVDSYTIKNEEGETLNVGDNQFIIRFVNDDNTLLQLTVVNKDDTPSYTNATPTKTATAQYTYTHAGWTPAITAATADATYTATFSSTVNKYNVKFVNWDGTELKSETLDYGAAITAPETEPTRANCDFAGWDNTVAATVTGDVTYKATFKLAGTENIVKDNEYVITFVNYNGTVLDSRIYAKDATVTAPTATRDNCTFKAWTPAFSATAVADATYTATFTTEDEGGNTIDIGKNQYVIRFVNEGGALLQTKVVDKNATPSYTGATPTKAADVQYTYTFDKFTPELEAATADKTYTATYTNTLNKYAVTVTGDAGVTVSANAKVDYGTVYTLTVTANEHYTNTAPTATVNGTALALTKNGNTYTANVTVDGAKTIAVTSTINSNTLTVTYKYENGTQASATKTSTVDYNATYSVASETISGYVPVIETLKDGETINTSAATVEGVMPDSDVNVNVIYKVDANNNGTPDEDDAKLTVTYVAGANGAIKAGETTEIKVTYNGAYKTAWRPETVADEDYMFSGWTNEPAAGTAITADVTITANFVEDRNHDGIADSEQASYTVKFVYNTEEISETVLTGLKATKAPDKATLNAAAPAGTCFKNWDKDPATTVITADTTFTANYVTDANGDDTPDDEETPWTVTYSYNGNTKTEKVLNNLTAKDVPTAEVLNAAAPAGQCFANWNADTSAKITADTTFIAVYADDANGNDNPDTLDSKWTVTYKFNGQTATETVLDGMTVANVPTKTTINNYAPAHKCFDGWDNDITAKITANTTFTANWADDKNGDGEPDYKVALDKYDITVTAPDNTTVDSKNINVEYAAETKITLTAATGYNLPASVTVKVGGTELTSDQYSYVGGVVTINEYVIVSDVETIVITGTATKVELTDTKAETTDTNTTVKVTTDPVTVVDPTVVKVTAKDGYDLPETVVVKVNGVETKDFTYDKTNGEITLKANVITSNNQTITVESAAAKTVVTGTTVTTTDANTTVKVTSKTVTELDPTEITVTPNPGYDYPETVAVKVDGVETKDFTYDKTTGKIVLGKDVITENGKAITVESKAQKTEITGTKAETTDTNTTVKVTTDPVTVVDPTVVKVTAKDGYDLPETVVVKVDGKELATDKYSYNKTTGEITLKADVIESNNQTVTVESAAAKTVVTGTTVSGGENINATLVTDPVTEIDPTVINIKTVTGYEMPDEIVVKVGGVETKDYTYDKTTGNITLGKDVIKTDGQEITVESKEELVKTEIKTVDIDTSDDTIKAEITNKPVTVVDDTEITISTDDGRNLPGTITVVVDGKELDDDKYEYTYDNETGTGKITIKADVITTENQKVEIIGSTTKKEVTGTTVIGGTNINATLDETNPVTIVDPTVINITTDTGYEMPDKIVVKVNGTETTDYTYDKTTGNIILGKDVITKNGQEITVESENELVKTEIKDVDIDTSDDTIKAEITNKPVTVVDDTEITISTDKGHELPDDITVKVDGKELDDDKYDYDSETGKITIKADVITKEDQKVEIIGSTTEKQVTGTTVTTKDENTSVEIITDPVTVIGETKIKITPDEGYDIPKDIKVKVGEDEISDYTYDVTTGTITLGKDVITEDGKTITIESTATKTELKDVDITAEDKNIAVTVDNINKLDDTEITLSTDKKYELPDDIKVVVDGEELDSTKYSYDKETGKVTINKDVITKDGQKVEIKGTATRITVWGDWESNGDGTMTRHSEEEGFEDLTQTVDCTNFTKKVIAPTCTVGGYTVYTCKDCGYTYNADETAAAGHKWGSWTVTSEATPEELGYKERECSVCHEKETISYEFNSANKRSIKFYTINKMHYQFLANSQEFTIYNSATVTWYQGSSLRFKVYNYTNTNVPYIYMDGYVELKPDADGWYTVPASDDDVIVFASNAKVEQYEEEGGGTSSGSGKTTCTCLCHSNNAFLQFIWKIIALICKIFGINKTCSCGKSHY